MEARMGDMEDSEHSQLEVTQPSCSSLRAGRLVVESLGHVSHTELLLSLLEDANAGGTSVHGVGPSSMSDGDLAMPDSQSLVNNTMLSVKEIDGFGLQDGQQPDAHPERRACLLAISAIAVPLMIMTSSLLSILDLVVFQPSYGASAISPGVTMRHWRRRSSRQVQKVHMVVGYFQMLARRALSTRRQIRGPWYVKPRSLQWHVAFIDTMPRQDPVRFQQLFRISPPLFYHLCELLHDDLITTPPSAFRCIPNRVLAVQRQVALAIRRLSTGDQFLGISELFGVSKSTAINVTWKFVKALNVKAAGHLKWPQGQQLEEVKAAILQTWGFPNCCGAIDATQFLAELPLGENVTAYIDQKHNVSVSMQAIVGADLRFLDVFAGWPGSIQDTRLLRKSHFFQDVVYKGTRLNGSSHLCRSGHMLREYVLGDAGYPLYDWLIVPFPGGVSASEDHWNTGHSAARMCVEAAFGKLKGTWRLLSRILYKPKKDRIAPVIFACCLLHNLIIEWGDEGDAEVYTNVLPRPTGYGPVAVPSRAYSQGGIEARLALQEEAMDMQRM